MFKRLFVFLLATFSVQSPIFAEGCKKFLESQGYVRSKVKGVIVKDVWYAFDEEFMNDESEFAPCEGILKGSTAMCKTTTLYPAESASWNKCILKNNRKLPFQGGETWCNGKLFHYGDLTYGMDPTVITFGGGENVGAGFFYDKNEKKSENLKNISDSSEILKLTNFFISKINSPYKEVKYLIKNNDTVEKILRKFKVRNSDINKISTNLKRKKLSSIYSGRELNLILKEVENGEKTVINFLLPINNTTSIEIRKAQEDFIVKENITNFWFHPQR